jgi:Amt family ammonium transporter
MMSAYYLYKKALVLPMINGGLIGLISVTAAADLMEASDAIIIAIIASLSIIPMTNLLEKLKIDDAVGAVPVHLIGGIIASFSAGFFVELTPEQSHSDAILIQVLGILSVGAFVFLTSFSLLWVINKFVKLRVSEEEEMLGLNLSEHSVGATNQDMIMQINENLRTGDVSNKINVSAESDSYDIAQHYNSMVDMFENLSSHKEEALKKAVFEANHDALTNLLNRRAMNAALNTQVKNMQKTLEPICVALIDIDNFKRINVTHGHDVGDNVIQYTASSIRNFVKTTDIVARAGGEEFCIIFPSTTLNETAGLLENLRDKLASFPLYTGDISISFTVSIGLTEMAPNKTIAQTLKEADIALYQAKNDGRNRLGIY